MTKLRVGFLGTGWIASAYAKALVAAPDVEIAGLCNHHMDKAEKFNAEHVGGKARCYADFYQMLEREKLDVLFVCIPPGAHTGQAEAAAKRGLHLFLEKPIALSMERAESIGRAVRESGVQCQIGHHMRHTAPVMKLKALLEDGSAGKPLLFQGRFLANALFPAWWRSPTMGGGQMVEQAIHIYDLARHFMGKPATVSAFADNLAHQRFADYKVDDVSAATIRFEHGAIASICAANCADPTSGSITFTVLCEKVMVEFANPERATFVYHHGQPAEQLKDGQPVTREEVTTTHNAGHEMVRNFLAGIRGTEPLRSGITDGVESLRLVLSAAASAKTNGTAQAL